MTRRWVKEELRNNPLADAVVLTVSALRKHKNNIFIALVVLITISLFIGMTVVNRIKENNEASKLFVFAQNDFDRFNYDAAIKKFEQIEQNFKSATILSQALYFKGISYYKLGNYEESEKALLSSLERSRNRIEPEVRMALAAVYEDLKKYDQALEQYNKIDDDAYMKPEAIAGIARIYETTQQKEKAIEYYEKMQSHYINTYWAEIAAKRLSVLSPDKGKKEEILPDLEF